MLDILPFRILKQHGLAPSPTSPLLAAVSASSASAMSPSASLEMILALERAKMLQQQQQPAPPPHSAAAAALKAFTDRQGKLDESKTIRVKNHQIRPFPDVARPPFLYTFISLSRNPSLSRHPLQLNELRSANFFLPFLLNNNCDSPNRVIASPLCLPPVPTPTPPFPPTD